MFWWTRVSRVIEWVICKQNQQTIIQNRFCVHPVYLGENQLAHGDEAGGDEERGEPRDWDADLPRLLSETGQHHAVLQVVQTHLLHLCSQVTLASQCFGCHGSRPLILVVTVMCKIVQVL